MKAQFQVLSTEERSQIHERSLKLLATTGLRVISTRARQTLQAAGAEVDQTSDIVRFPRRLVEESLRLAPRQFSLGSRRTGRDLKMNADDCTLLADGGAVSVLDWENGNIHPGTPDDWLIATHLIDALDEIGIYWNMIEGGIIGNTPGDFVAYWRKLLKNCSKHIQDSTDSLQKSKWLLEILQIAFGDRTRTPTWKPLAMTSRWPSCPCR
jgi:trimethylamine:corrinoid methyltransferase-like protein